MADTNPEPDESAPDESSDTNKHLATGIALGTPLGVAIALITDNWGLLGIGVALGIALGVALDQAAKKDDAEDGPADQQP